MTKSQSTALIAALATVVAASIAAIASCSQGSAKEDSRATANVTVNVNPPNTATVVASHSREKQDEAPLSPSVLVPVQSRADLAPDAPTPTTAAKGRTIPPEEQQVSFEQQRYLARSFLETGLKRRNEGQESTAVSAFITSLELDHSLTEARIALTETLIRLARYSEARAEALALVIRNEKDPRSHFLFSECAQATDDLETALASIKKALALRPDDLRFRLASAHIMRRMGQYSQSLPDYLFVTERTPDNTSASLGLGYALSGMGEWRRAISPLEGCLSKLPEDTTLREELAKAYWNVGEHSKAISTISGLMECSPLKSRYPIAIADYYLQDNDISNAVKFYRLAIKFDGSSADAYAGLGRALRKREDKGGAVGALQKALELQPGHANARMLLSFLFIDDGKYAEAVDTLRVGIAISPKTGEYFHNLGIAYRAQGKFDDAIGAILKVIEISPESSEDYHLLGTIYYSKGTTSEALTAFRQAVVISPENAVYAYSLGAALFNAKDYTGAVERLERAVAGDPKNEQYRETLGRATKLAKK